MTMDLPEILIIGGIAAMILIMALLCVGILDAPRQECQQQCWPAQGQRIQDSDGISCYCAAPEGFIKAKP